MERTLIVNTDPETTDRLRKLLRGTVEVTDDLPDEQDVQRVDRILLGTDSPARSREMARRLERVNGPEVIAVGRISDPELLTDLCQHGVTRFLGWPFPPDLVQSWLQPENRTLQYGHGHTGRHRRHRNRPDI